MTMSEAEIRRSITSDPIYERILATVYDSLGTVDYKFDEDRLNEEMSQSHNNTEVDHDDIEELESCYSYDYHDHICDDELMTKLSEWKDLKQKYYNALSYTVYSCKIGEVLQHIKKQLEAFLEYLGELEIGFRKFWFTEKQRDDFIMDTGITDLWLSRDYPHGWQSHTDEKEHDELYLLRCLNRQVEGCNSVSLRIHNNLWATVTIDRPVE